ncbi:NAD(P)-dependent oxidoreductase [Paludibacter sp.]|uniref:NAD-dependent epimerase/dehydratase family protein n=1 Tax=Paludibacter sp. TaxID=1898105 RepID=UPI001352903C|nr:NAD(P)-dependent oxidoreductase [Paludibacter sp.]MTK52805.1 NAD(P)-dependent oxidoreductase [Paludibacter sp.]
MILITGATGFIGSNIARELLDRNYMVCAIYRNSSSFEKCADIKNKITWVNSDAPDWKYKIQELNPKQLIHTAWGGVGAKDRNDWELQINNFWFSKELFDLVKTCDIKKVIAFGSQAEYGSQGFAVNEETSPKPDDAYGAVKTMTAHYMRNIFEKTEIAWYWVRVFSVFGEFENSNWLIPTVISKLLNNRSIQLTKCEQQYNYLYIKDFTSQLLGIIDSIENKSGVYNICDSKSVSLQQLLRTITEFMGVPEQFLEFGAIPYREGQNMLIAGDNTKFKKNFPISTKIGLNEGLNRTIKHHKERLL